MDIVKVLQPVLGCSEAKVKEYIAAYIEKENEILLPQNKHHNHFIEGTRVLVYPVKVIGRDDKFPVIIGLQIECEVGKDTHKFLSVKHTTPEDVEVKKVMKQYRIPFISHKVLKGCTNECLEELKSFIPPS